MKLPLVLFVKIKQNFGLKDLESDMDLNNDQVKELKQDLKQDPWAPIAVWHSQPVDRRQHVEVSDVLDHAVKYAKALFTTNPKSAGWPSFTETERFT
ncbi:MAG: hypothetical protein ACFFCX_16110 [Candidatus Sifarchaeia archaeon]